MKNIIKNNKGFTLVEIIVSVSIIGLISGLFLTNYHGTKNSSELIMAARKLSSDIRVAQNYTLGLKKFKGDLPYGGWGLNFNSTNNDRYILFADMNEDPALGYTYEAVEQYQEIKLPRNIIISAIEVDGVPKSFLNLVFEPPYSKVYANLDNNKNSKIILTNGEKTIEVFVNFFGLIDIIQ